MEWAYAARKVPMNVRKFYSLFQIATESDIILVQIAVPPATDFPCLINCTLKGIFKSRRVAKIGVNLKADAKREANDGLDYTHVLNSIKLYGSYATCILVSFAVFQTNFKIGFSSFLQSRFHGL